MTTDTENYPRDMYTSVSAITDADDCLRRWWFNKRCKLPQDQRKAPVFGDVLHAVAERYLRADSRGIDPLTGKPVDLYPPGWEVMKDRWTGEDTLYKISNEEAALVKVLIHKAIVEGVLVREPGRVVEKMIETEIYCVNSDKIILKGFIDLDTPRGLEDHKSTSNRKYLLSKAKLRKSIQMMTYAYVRYLEGHKGNIWVGHNGFVKDFDNPLVKKTDVEITEIEVIEFFNDKVLPIVKKMFRYYQKYPKTLIYKWRDIPPANNPNQSCNHHYGKPCPYITICGGVSTIDQYLKKYGKTVEDIIGITENIEKGKILMTSLIDTIKKEQAAHASTAIAKPVITTAGQLVPAVEVVEEATPVNNTGSLSNLLARMTGAAKSAIEAIKPDTAKSVLETISTEVSKVAEKVNEVAEIVQDVQQTETLIESKQKAPWYTLNADGTPCVACSDNSVLGYNSKMEPCQICDVRAREFHKPTSADFAVTVLEGGALQFTPLAGGKEVSTTVAKEPIVKTDVQPVVGLPEEKPLISVDKAADVADATVFAVRETISEAVLGFDLLIGCVFVSAIKPSSVATADTILQVILDDIEQVAGKPISSVDHFELMQAIDALIPSMIKDLSGSTVISVMPSKGSSHARLIDGLRLHAKTIIQPLVN